MRKAAWPASFSLESVSILMVLAQAFNLRPPLIKIPVLPTATVRIVSAPFIIENHVHPVCAEVVVCVENCPFKWSYYSRISVLLWGCSPDMVNEVVLFFSKEYASFHWTGGKCSFRLIEVSQNSSSPPPPPHTHLPKFAVKIRFSLDPLSMTQPLAAFFLLHILRFGYM